MQDQRKGAASSRPAKVKVVYFCQVDGCNVKLSNCKPYCVRYRVCPSHLGAPSAELQGVNCRFCQQCGKFHPLAEFDGTKRSCRVRLQHHNNSRQQRRKEAALQQSIKTSLLLQQHGTRQAVKQHRIITSCNSPETSFDDTADPNSIPKRASSGLQLNNSNSSTSTELNIHGSPAAESGNTPMSHCHQQQPATHNKTDEVVDAGLQHKEPQSGAVPFDHWSSSPYSDDHAHQQQVQQRRRQRMSARTGSNTHLLPAATTATATTVAGLVHTADGMWAAAMPQADYHDGVSADRQNPQAVTAPKVGPEQQPTALYRGVILEFPTQMSLSSVACFAGNPAARPEAAAAGPQYSPIHAVADDPAALCRGYGGNYHMHSTAPQPESMDCTSGPVSVRYCDAPDSTQGPPTPPFPPVIRAAMQQPGISNIAAQHPPNFLPAAAAHVTNQSNQVDAAATRAGLLMQQQAPCSSLYGHYSSFHNQTPTWYCSKQHSRCYQPCATALLKWSSPAQDIACGAAERQQLQGEPSNGSAVTEFSPISSSSTYPGAVFQSGIAAAPHGGDADDGAVTAVSQQQSVSRQGPHSTNWQLTTAGAVGPCNWQTQHQPAAAEYSTKLCQQFDGVHDSACTAHPARNMLSTATSVPGCLCVPDGAEQYKQFPSDMVTSSTIAGSNGNARAAGIYGEGDVAIRYPSQLRAGHAAAAAAAAAVFGVPGASNPAHHQAAAVAADARTVLYGHPVTALLTSAYSTSTTNQYVDTTLPGSSNTRGHASAGGVADGATQATADPLAVLQQWSAASMAVDTMAATATHIREPDSCWLPQQRVAVPAQLQRQQQRQQLRLPRLLAPEVVARCSTTAPAPHYAAAAASGRPGWQGWPGLADHQPELMTLPSAAAAASGEPSCPAAFPERCPAGMQAQIPLPAVCAADKFTAAENAYLDSLAAATAAFQHDADSAAQLAPTRLKAPGLDAGVPANPHGPTFAANMAACTTGQAVGVPGSLAGPEHQAMTAQEGGVATTAPQSNLPYWTPPGTRDSGKALIDVFKQWGSEEDELVDELLAPMLSGACLASDGPADGVEELIKMVV